MIDAVFRKRAMIEASLKASPGGHTFEELVNDVVRGECIVLEGVNSVMVLEINPDNLNGWIVGGDLSEIVALIPGAEALARGLNKKWGAFQVGRPGWRRFLKRLGYEWDGEMHRKAL